ncbi:GNAT family N-acetyltransferase [Nocardia stercoris]|uniref:GNAT family N-acetyltransferase n=1 Tax=Nocardia stercoris TaxID=2483361 RepID=A0A3M2KSA3_9NOCA|nr:GNAT family N-acetyltransferase [Nocardia stercoris]RMI28359.1 GNAT family N-acetyltransferase [Nocardia stercoris]
MAREKFSGPSDCHVRPAGRGDHGAVLDLITSFYRQEGFATATDVLAAHLTTLIVADNARVAVAIAEHRCAGFGITTTSFGLEQGLVAELEDLYVHPDLRHRGIASALIEDSARWAREWGCGELELVVADHGHGVGALLEFYRRRGFADGGRRLVSRRL